MKQFTLGKRAAITDRLQFRRHCSLKNCDDHRPPASLLTRTGLEAGTTTPVLLDSGRNYLPLHASGQYSQAVLSFYGKA